MTTQRPPNILLIMDDQHRWDYLGCYGAEFVDTPNIDRLAASGVRFAHAFTNSPVCAPSRIGLASGLHPARLDALENDTYLPPQLPTDYQRHMDQKPAWVHFRPTSKARSSPNCANVLSSIS